MSTKPGSKPTEHTNGNSLAGKTILLVNTGSPKKRFIVQRLKKLGLKVVCLNREKNWAQPYVDHWILADNSNHNESVQAVRTFTAANPSIKIDGAVTFWEDDVLLTSRIVDRYNFVGIPLSIAKKTRNKWAFRGFCQKNGLPAPQFHLVRDEEDLKFIEKHFTFPVVIKPAFGASSAFVMKVMEKGDLRSTFNYIRNNISSSVESALADGLDIFVEEFIDGDEVDVDVLIQNGKIKFQSISDNFNKNKGVFFVDSGQSIPSTLPDQAQEDIMDMVEETLEKLGIQNGCIHFEAKYCKKGAFPIECNLRMGGDYVYSYTKDAWGIDLIEYSVKIALGEYIKINQPENPKRYIIGWDLHPDESGVLVELTVPEDIKKKNKFVEEVEIYKEIGDSVLTPPDGFESLGWLTVSGENVLDAKDNLDETLKLVTFKVVKFDPASSIGKTQRKDRFSPAFFSTKSLISHGKIEKIRKMSLANQRKLHVGIACNSYTGGDNPVEQELLSVGRTIEKALLERGYHVSFFDFNNLVKVFNDLEKSNVDLVFNVCERINGSSLLEPHAAAILDTLEIPYTGSSPFTLALCIDKIRVKKLLTYHGIPTPQWDYVYDMTDDIRPDLQYPLIVKPANTDNSIGITNDSVVTSKEQLHAQLKKIIVDIGSPALIEEFIDGDEYDVSIMGSDSSDLRVLPLCRSLFDQMPKGFWHIYAFDSKWESNEVYNKIVKQRPPKNISPKLTRLITEIALDTYNILHCHDYGRVEIRVDKNNNPHVLELNPNPSINNGNEVPKSAALVGLDYGDFLEEIIRMTIERYKKHPPYYHLQSNII